MLVSTLTSEPSTKAPGFCRYSFCWLFISVLGKLISLPSSHCVVWLENVLPRCGVPMVITRRIDGLGWK